MGISSRFFSGVGSVRVWFLGFRFCSVPVPFLFRSWVSGRVLVRVLVLGSRGLSLFLFRSRSGHVSGSGRVPVLF